VRVSRREAMLFPATTISEFIFYARANPGKINMVSAGSGSPPRVTGELFKMMAGINAPGGRRTGTSILATPIRLSALRR